MVAAMKVRILSLWGSLRDGMRHFGDDIAGLINTVLLLIVYVFGVGLTALVAKLVGKQFLDRKPVAKKNTYWRDVSTKKPDMDSHFRQF